MALDSFQGIGAPSLRAPPLSQKSVNHVPVHVSAMSPVYTPFAGGGAGTSTVDCVFDGINGFDEFIVLDAAIAILGKEESDTARLERERAKIEGDLRMMAEDRDAAFPGQVQDTQSLYWQINPTGRAY